NNLPMDSNFLTSSPKKTFKKCIKKYTVSQLLSTNEDTSIIQLVGWVRDVKNLSNGTVFILEDSNNIECAYWPSNPLDDINSGLIEVNSILMVTGTLRNFNNKKSITVTNIQKINDSNFMFYHYLSVIKQNTKKDFIEEPTKNHNNIKDDILQCYRNNQDANGLHLDIVINMLKNKYKEEDIIFISFNL
ncbi:Replication factor A protein 2, partial [Spraguea lophii 42_110]